mmetsp:Transcript_32651/g.39527  ORF Transcript_32651/g.39527 Transcript_32651/m.39527 type:complete len:200 (-) Transcript_32651:3305-3904(-)
MISEGITFRLRRSNLQPISTFRGDDVAPAPVHHSISYRPSPPASPSLLCSLHYLKCDLFPKLFGSAPKLPLDYLNHQLCYPIVSREVMSVSCNHLYCCPCSMFAGTPSLLLQCQLTAQLHRLPGQHCVHLCPNFGLLAHLLHIRGFPFTKLHTLLHCSMHRGVRHSTVGPTAGRLRVPLPPHLLHLLENVMVLRVECPL